MQFPFSVRSNKTNIIQKYRDRLYFFCNFYLVNDRSFVCFGSSLCCNENRNLSGPDIYIGRRSLFIFIYIYIHIQKKKSFIQS